jgi:hypothetical protein
MPSGDGGDGLVSPAAMAPPSVPLIAVDGPLGSEQLDRFVFGVAITILVRQRWCGAHTP